MIVCLCDGVRLSEVEEAIRRGARTLLDVESRCGAGTRCGACRKELEGLLARSGGVGDARPPDPREPATG